MDIPYISFEKQIKEFIQRKFPNATFEIVYSTDERLYIFLKSHGTTEIRIPLKLDVSLGSIITDKIDSKISPRYELISEYYKKARGSGHFWTEKLKCVKKICINKKFDEVASETLKIINKVIKLFNRKIFNLVLRNPGCYEGGLPVIFISLLELLRIDFVYTDKFIFIPSILRHEIIESDSIDELKTRAYKILENFPDYTKEKIMKTLELIMGNW